MKVFGIVLNHNILAVILGIFMIFLGLMIAYLFQTKFFGKYRRKVPNSRVTDDSE